MTDLHWPPELETAVAHYALQGMSAALAAEKLTQRFNLSITKGMCVGKVKRMVLAGQASKHFHSRDCSGPSKNPVRVSRPRPVRLPPTPHFIFPWQTNPRHAVSLLHADSTMCRWPANDARGVEFMVCGHAVEEGRSYCPGCENFAFKR